MKKNVKTILKKIISCFNFTIRKKMNGRYFKIPIIEGIGVYNLLMEEKWMIDLLKKTGINSNTKFVDVGVNIGQTLLKVKSIDDNIEYIGFEPNPSCVHYLKKLIKKNTFKNITLLPIGVFTKTTVEELNFYDDNDIDPSASIIDLFRTNKIYKKEFVPLYDVKGLSSKVNLDNMSILKIDVEGAELDVLESFVDNIKTNKPIILMEILPVYNEKENPERFFRQNKIELMLKDLDYYMFRINKNKDKFVGIKKIESIGIHSNLNNCDYVFISKPELSKLKGFAIL